MPTEPRPESAGRPRPPRWPATLVLPAVLALLSLPDLFSPPITPTGLRQVQTFSQTVHFVAAGFSPTGLTLDIDGPNPFRVVYEFPLYQALAGLAFLAFGPAVIWGKLISLAAAVTGFAHALRLARRHWPESVVTRAGWFVAASPAVLLVSASFQPDALALALTVGAGLALVRWRAEPRLGRWLAFLVWFTVAALAKFTVLVPFLPLFAWGVFRRERGWRMLRPVEWLAALALFLVPFVAWNLYRGTLMDPRYLVFDRGQFLLGDLRRFLSGPFYAKPAFIIGAMVLCGVGVPLALLGFRDLDAPGWALVAGIPLYYVLLPTAASQTYYAFPVVPAFALLAARGSWRLETMLPARAKTFFRPGLALAWLAGFAVAAPYTLRHDTISLAAAHAARAASAPDDLLFVINMHDRGVAIGGFNPTIITLAERRGWNIDFASADPQRIRAQVEARRAEGARWLVTTWYSPDLEPWFTPLLPAAFGRQPRFDGTPVDGRGITDALARDYPVVARGPNHAVLRLP